MPGRIEAEAAGIVGYVHVDLVGVAAQPVVVGAGGGERGVERGEVDFLLRVDGRSDDIHGRRARQHRAVEPRAVVEQISLERERAHAVPDDDQGQPRVRLASDAAELADVAHQARPAARAQVTVPFGRPGGAAMAAVVVGVHDVAGGGESLRQPPVAGRVLAHAVGDLHDGPRCRVAGPAVRRDRGSVGCIE